MTKFVKCQQMLAWMWGEGNRFSLSVGVQNLCIQLWKSVKIFLKKLEINLPHHPPIPLQGNYPRTPLYLTTEILTHPWSLLPYSHYAENGNHSDMHQLMNQKSTCCVLSQWNFIQLIRKLSYEITGRGVKLETVIPSEVVQA